MYIRVIIGSGYCFSHCKREKDEEGRSKERKKKITTAGYGFLNYYFI